MQTLRASAFGAVVVTQTRIKFSIPRLWRRYSLSSLDVPIDNRMKHEPRWNAMQVPTENRMMQGLKCNARSHCERTEQCKA